MTNGEQAYRIAWDTYYTPEHIRTILRRSAAVQLGRPETTLRSLVWFYVAAKYEGVHPLESGVVRLKFRCDRRPGLPLENPLVFYPRYLGESLVKLSHYWRMFRRGMEMLKKIENDPNRWTYSDLAIAPPQADEFESLDLYHATSGGEAALARTRRNEALIAGVNVTARAVDPA